MKKLVLLTLLFTVFFTIYTKAEEFKTDIVKINYLNQGVKIYAVLYNNGRIYVPFEEICDDFGINRTPIKNGYALTKNDKITNVFNDVYGNPKSDMCLYDNIEYVYLYKVVEPFGTMPLVDIDTNTITVLKTQKGDVTQYKTASPSPKQAFIRLEDIMADGLDTSRTPKYSTDMLEDLRYTAQYLFDSAQSYYIAWIPVYANPKANYWNDVSINLNLYNAYFVYTLDFMTAHNGHLGVHGYTHQYGDAISADGYEWGSDTPYSVEEQENRMKKAIRCANALGYNPEFFEFPHYGATNAQIRTAEKYFNFIYQSYPFDSRLHNNFTYTDVYGKRVYFMPTPADYVHYKGDIEKTISLLSNAINQKYAVSLFFHPVIDCNDITEETVGDTRVWHYNSGCLQRILSYISSLGYQFMPID